MKRRILIAMLVGICLAAVVSGCSGAKNETGVKENTSVEKEQETDILDDFYEVQMLKSILNSHENIQRSAKEWNADGENESSFMEYMDKNMYVLEENDSDIYILDRENKCDYQYTSSEGEDIMIGYSMDGATQLEDSYNELISEGLGFYPKSENEKLIESTEKDGNICLTVEEDAEAAKDDYEKIADSIETGDKIIWELTADAKTYEAKKAVAYLKKADGTRTKVGESVYSYDITPYEVPEKILTCVEGTGRTEKVVADAGTEKEKTYTMSCGKNGKMGFYLAKDYESFYLDKDCTKKWEGESLGNDILLYIAEGK